MDLWTHVLQFLSRVIMPDWGTVIAALPILLVILLLGPVLTIVALGWVASTVRRRRGRVRLATVEVSPVARDAFGAPAIPANVPYCPRDELTYGPRVTRCTVCGDELVVRCPVDGTVRPAARQVCASCGTRYVLGELPALVSATRAGPPPGGAAAA